MDGHLGTYETTGSNHATIPWAKQSGKTWLWLSFNTYLFQILLLMLGPGPCRSRLWRAIAFSEPQQTRKMYLAACHICIYIYYNAYMCLLPSQKMPTATMPFSSFVMSNCRATQVSAWATAGADTSWKQVLETVLLCGCNSDVMSAGFPWFPILQTT